MTRTSFAIAAVALTGLTLTGCAVKNGDWHRDCQRHFSSTDRELSQCKQKVEDNQRTTIAGGQVSLDPKNTTRESFDDIGKGGASDQSRSN